MASRRRFTRRGPEKLGDGSDASADPSRVRSAAVALLARREHSTSELIRKLESRGFDVDITSVVLADLGRKGLLSDERYVASFITHHVARGQGPQRIRAELREAGIAGETIERLLESADADWVETARAVRRKKFGEGLPQGFAERAKQSRFLQYRGFSQDQIRGAMGAGADPDDSEDPGRDD